MPPYTTDQIRQVQRQQTDYFLYWRLGQAHGYNRNDRKDAIARNEFPRKGKWMSFRKGLGRPLHRARKIIEVWEEAGPQETYLAAQQANAQMAARMEVAGFKFVKILGWGGLGVASLFESVDPRRRRRKVVCKMDLRKDVSCIKGEIQMHLVSKSWEGGSWG
jgi:hypothetical protein